MTSCEKKIHLIYTLDRMKQYHLKTALQINRPSAIDCTPDQEKANLFHFD